MTERVTDEEVAALTIMSESGFYYTSGLRQHELCAELARRGLAVGEQSQRSEYLPLPTHPDRYRITRDGLALLWHCAPTPDPNTHSQSEGEK